MPFRIKTKVIVMLDPTQSVADLVLDHSECAPVLQKHRIDYCCRGDVSVSAAALARGLDLGELLVELDHAIQERRARPSDPRAWSNEALVLHLTNRHHAYLRTALPFVGGLSAKVSRVHGEHNAKLRDVAQCVRILTDTLLPHLDDEEHTLFPLLLSAESDPERIERMMRAMMDEHRAVGALLEHLRAAADDFLAPDWACNSYRTLMKELHQLEGDTLTHVHLENHVLRPRFTATLGA